MSKQLSNQQISDHFNTIIVASSMENKDAAGYYAIQENAARATIELHEAGINMASYENAKRNVEYYARMYDMKAAA